LIYIVTLTASNHADLSLKNQGFCETTAVQRQQPADSLSLP
jgi:hypothetical protein